MVTMYLCIIIITELLMLTMTLHVINYSGFTKEQKFWYLVTFLAIALCAGAEFLAHCNYFDANWNIPLTIITVIQFSIAPLLGVFFSGALGLHKYAKYASIFFSLNFIIEVIAAFNGWIFKFENGIYARGDFFNIYSDY